MSQRRVIAAVFFSVAIVAVLGVLVWVEKVNSTRTVVVYELKSDVSAGTPYRDENVQPVSIRAQDGDFAHERRGPAEFRARFATALHPGDIVREDDLVPADSLVEIALNITTSPALSPGDTVDVYASVNGNSALVGPHLTVVTGSPAVTVLVPADEEAAWVAASSSATAFHAVKNRADVRGGGDRALTPDQALRLLCGSPCG